MQRILIAFLAAAASCSLAMFACSPLEIRLLYWLYLAAESLGLTPRSAVGAMQILGRYFQGPPPAVRWTVTFLSTFTLFIPAGIPALAICHILRGPAHGPTRCGRCRGILKDLLRPECPHCDNPL